MRQQQRPGRWNNFFELRWYDKILDFIFKLAARSSEVLLAAGVILATANHFQHGELFSTPALDAYGQFIRHSDGSLKMTETILFDFWSWTQAIGFEACSGVVLVTALEAKRNGDKVKRNILLLLVIGLSLVGTTMLIMAFIESATGIKESDLPAYYGVTMAILRSVVSVAYIMIGRVKHLRFSGTEDPFPNTPDALTQLATLGEQIERIEANTQHRLTELTEHLNSLTELLPNTDRTPTEQRPNTLTKDRTATEQVPNILMEDRTATEQSPNTRLSVPNTYRTVTEQSPNYIDEGPNFYRTVTEYIDGGPNRHRTVTEHGPNISTEDRTATEQSPNSHRIMGGEGVNEESEISNRKARFVKQCLTEWPNISNREIRQRAALNGLSISSSYTSECRKAFLSATSPEPPIEDEEE